MKRGQITFFIILAIVLIATGILAYYMVIKPKANNEFFSSADIKPSMDSIKNSIVGCEESSITDSLEDIGIQGGYYNKPERYLEVGPTFIPYYYYEGDFFIPDKIKVENELSSSVNDSILKCIDDIKMNDFEISHKTSKTTALIDKGEVKFIIDMPITIKKETNSITLEMKDLPITKKSKLYESIEIAKYISESNKENPGNICVTCVEDMAKERDLYVTGLELDDSEMLFLVIDNSSSSKNYYFEFLNRYIQKEVESFNIPEAPVENK